MKLSVVFTLLLLGCTACVRRQSSDDPLAAGADRGARDRDLITMDEFSGVSGSEDLYEAIRRLRPHFIRSRGPTSTRSTAATATVYIGSTLAGSIDVLHNLRTEHVLEVRYLDPSSATIRYGTNNSGGAIVVTLRTQ